MEIKNQTEYTYEALMEFNYQHKKNYLKRSRRIYAVLTALILLLFAVGLVFPLLRGESPLLDNGYAVILGVCLAINVFFLFATPLLIKRAVRKQAAQNSVVTYRFTEEGFEESTVSSINRSQSQNTYSVIVNATESEHAFYLYTTPVNAHIVSKAGFTEGTEKDLRDLLRMSVPADKLHIK
jgi:multisubunit Na+/H+ antiporter MnhG subunit